MKENNGIAIVGMDCRYPGADNPEQYWENILSLRQQFRRIPDKRLNLDYYHSEDRSKIDYTYAKKASVLSGYHFDRIKYRVSKSTFEQTDMAHWLALDVAAGALRDAGFEDGNGLNKERVGVILGNSLNGEFTRANVMRLRWPYVLKVLESTLSGMEYSKEDIVKIISSTEKVYKEPFPAPDADNLAGGLSNTIAGRICNYFDFNGGGFTMDGACASSLLAFTNGCNSIVNGELDAVLVGGVDLSIDAFEVIGFSRNGALATNEMEVFSSKSEGFWPGEGCGIVVLMKESEAIAKGLNIYAVIKGWGISSDGKGGITRPKPDTQQLAFERAYQRAGYDISTIAMFEGHGTGTPLGDKVEITALVNSLKKANKEGRPAVLGSVKHLIGHTKAAAGVAGLIKASLAIKNGVVPGSLRTENAHTLLRENADMIQLAQQPMAWVDSIPMRASVSSMGFGGINVHLTMEEDTHSKRAKKVSGKVRKLSTSSRDCEIFPIAANSKASFLQKIKRLQELARDISRSEFVDLSASISASFQHTGRWKASLVANTPDSLLENLSALDEAIAGGEMKLLDIDKGIFFRADGRTGKIGFLFPGQGSPVYSDLGAFAQLSKELLNISANRIDVSNGTADTLVAQPAIVQSTLRSVELLEHLGVEAEWGIGHSLGEISALSWAGVLSTQMAYEVANIRGLTMSEFGEKDGAMLALRCKQSVLHDLLESRAVWVTGYNGHRNYVLGGKISEIEEIQKRAYDKGIANVRLKVSHAFHTPMMKKAAKQFKQSLKSWEFGKVNKNIISTVTGFTLDKDVDFTKHLFTQIEQPVRFTQAIESIEEEVDFLIELGPGNALTKSLKGYESFKTLALDYGSRSLRGLFNVLSAAYVSGNVVHFEELSHNRFYKPFDIGNWKLDVLVNPCEKTDHKSTVIQNIIQATPEKKADEVIQTENVAVNTTTLAGVNNYIKNLISEKTEIPVEVITDEDKIMSRLHLNSLAITEIISIVTKTLNKSHKVFSAASILANADGTIGELSKLIFEGDSGSRTVSEKRKVGFDLTHNWTHVFKRKNTAKKASRSNVDRGVGKITVHGLESVSQKWSSALAQAKLSVGDGAVFVYKSESGKEVLKDVVDFLNSHEVRNGAFVALVNLNTGSISGDLRPILRTFQQEVPQILAFSLELDNTLENKERILISELKTTSKFKEILYDVNGQRSESECEAFFPSTGDITKNISEGDVILASGGGKGITFESIMDLALNTGAKLAILGRSLPKKDAVLEANLVRLASHGVEYRYYAADVCDPDAVKQAISQTTTELGPVNIFIHGAGMNKPKPLTLLTQEDFERTLSVKVDGIRNVVESLDLQKLKILIGYGSIIAQSGMQGNADYAWANDQLALYIDELSRREEHIRCLTLEWSVWDEVGMGVSLNSIETLKEKNVWPIPVKQGLDILKALIADKNCKTGRYIVSGRYGQIPTLPYAKERLPLGRFISKVKHYVPKVEIVSEVNINLKDDIYLENHVFQNQYVFPTVMILEGIAQNCNVLNPDPESWTFEDLEIHKSIFIPKKGSNVIRFVVSRISENRFKAIAQSEDSNFEVNCFEVVVNFGSVPDFKLDTKDITDLKALDFDVERKFYDDLLFHHGPFRRIRSFTKIRALESIAVADSNIQEKWFGPFIPADYKLGDPGLNDAAIHCHQACRPEGNLLPVGASEIAINPVKIEGPFFIKTKEIREEKNDTIIDVYVVNGKGEVKEYWKELVLTKVSGTTFSGEWDQYLLLAYIEYKLIQLTGKKDVGFSADSCQRLLKALKSGETSITHEMGGYLISLKKKNLLETGSEIDSGTVSDKKPQLSQTLDITDMDEKILLEIFKPEPSLASI